jgi:hypothetical protein
VNGAAGTLQSCNASPNHSPTTTDDQGFLVELMGPMEEFKVRFKSSKFKVGNGETLNTER